MGADDFAILVGISVYPNPGFPSLSGPSKDIELMKRWLTDSAGGAVPDDNEHILIIESPVPYPQVDDPDRAPPVAEAFDIEFRKLLRKRMTLKEGRVKGRLYLYFAGHGFCNRRINRDSEAALYSANATKDYYDHIYGTQYARVAKGKALFQETVLVMDCCRDSEVNREPVPRPYTDTPDDGLAADALLLSIYAVPKGGKAQEREIEERGGAVHGLLTHALIKALDEARPTHGRQIDSTALRAHILQTWDSVCGPNAPPRPEIFPPGSGDIFFNARNAGVEISIEFSNAYPPGTMLILRDGKLNKVAEFSAIGDAKDDLVATSGPVIATARKNSMLILTLKPGFYEYELIPPVGNPGKFKIEGAGGHFRL